MLPAGEEWVVLGLRLTMAAALLGFVAAVMVVARRELAALERAATAPVGQPTAADLVVLDGGRSGVIPGTRWPISTGVTIGRLAANDIAIDDPFLSGEHAEITCEAGSRWVRDRGSTNGTLLNGAPVVGQTAIRVGDVLQFGNIRLQVLPGDPPLRVAG